MFKTKFGKLKFGLYVFFLVTLATLLTVGNLAEASLLQAQKFADSGPVISPTGRVLQASTGNIGNDIQDALQLESIPPNPSLGSKAQLKVSVKKDKLIPGDDQLGFTVIGWANCGIFSCDKVLEKDIKGTDAIIDYVVTPEIFKNPGQKTLTVKATSVFTSFGSTRTTYIGSVNINVVPGSENSSTLSVTRETRDGQIAVKEFTVFSQGAASVNFDCGNGQKGTVSAASGSAKFECRYPISSPGTFQIKAIAQGPTGQQVGEALNSSVSITGQEASTGDSAQQNRLKSCVLGPETLVCIVNLLFGVIGTLIETAVKGMFLLIVGPAIEVLISVHTWDDNFANVIYSSWLILRNLTNIAFILAIVAMGVATVFRISGYAVKDMMVKLIIGAFLVNFSLVIPQAILGIAETVQNQFLPPNTGAIRAIANPLFTLNLFNGAPSNVDFGSFSESVRIFMNVWMIVFAFIAFAALACLLIIRLVIIWLLLLSSPLPYVAMIFPATRKFASDWWGRLIEWAFITPVMAFMLNLTANISLNQKGVIEKLSNVQPGSLGIGNASVLYVALSSGLPIIFLFATLKISTALATKAGGLASTVMNKASTLTGLGAGSAVGYALTKPAKKFLYEPGKDWAQTQYMGLVGKIAPKEGEKTVPRFLKRQAYNILSGGQYFKAKEKDRKEKLEYAKMDFESVATDYRNAKKNYKLDAVKRAQEVKRNKDVKEIADGMIKDSLNDTKKDLEKLLGEANIRQLTYGEQAKLEALVQKSLKDKTFDKTLDKLGLSITQFYERLEKGAGGGEAGKTIMQRVVADVNPDGISNGKFHYVVNPDNPTNDPGLVTVSSPNRDGFIKQRLAGKTAEEMAAVKTKTYANISGGVVSGYTDGIIGLAQLGLEFTDPVKGAELSTKMARDQKDEIKLILNYNPTIFKSKLVEANGGSHNFTYFNKNTGMVETIDEGEVYNRMLAQL